MGVYYELYPYHRAKWPAHGPVIHTAKGMIDVVKWFPNSLMWDLTEVRGFRDPGILKPIPERVALFLRYPPDEALQSGATEELTQDSPIGDRIKYIQAGKLAQAMRAEIDSYSMNTAEDEDFYRWMQDKLRKVARLKKTTPILVYVS